MGAVTLLQTLSKTGRANKRFDLNPDGSIRKFFEPDSGHYDCLTSPYEGMSGFADLMRALGTDPSMVLSLGVFPDAPEGQFHVWPRKAIAKRLRVPKDSEKCLGWHTFPDVDLPVIGRLKANMVPGGLLGFDRDVPPEMPQALIDLDFEGWLAAMDQLWPGIAAAGHVVVPSATGRLLVNGVPEKSPGYHLYVAVDDPIDAARRIWPQLMIRGFAETLPSGCPLSFMRPKFSRTDRSQVVAQQEWSIYDPSTIGAERLFFDGAPTAAEGKGLAIAAPTVRFKPGPVLRCSDFQDVTAEQARPAALRGVRLERKRGQMGVTSGFQVNVETLTLDTETEGAGELKTMRGHWLAASDKVRCQSPFRESASMACYINRHGDGTPFLYDSGTNTKYLFTRTALLQLGVDDFLDALKAWLGTKPEKLTPPEIEHAGSMVTNIVTAAARHEWDKSMLSALAASLAEMLSDPYGQAKGKLTKTLESSIREMLKKVHRLGQEDAAAAVSGATAHPALAEMNATYAVLRFGNKVLVAEPDRHDPCLDRRFLGLMSKTDFEVALANRTVTVQTPSGPMEAPAAPWWLKHPDRRQYLGGVTCDPSGTVDGREFLNLWRGFSVEPVEGDCSIFPRHLDLLAMGNGDEAREYLEKWLAWKIQNPGERCEVTIVLRGRAGTGKGALGRVLMSLFGVHGVYVSQASHLVGKFNSHLMDACFLFADEAFFAGDRAHASVLKSLITEPFLMIEPKGINSFQTKNRLGILMASNEDWVIPASADERRYFVLDVPDARAQDADYFGPLAAATADPAQLGAFLHHLQNVDLTGFNIRRAPYTKALGDQKTESFKPEERWLLDGLMRGHMSPLTEVVIGGHARWPEWYTTAALFDAYKRWCDEHHRMLYSRNRVHFGRFMAKFYPPYREQRQTGYRFGPLAEARERFEAVTGTAGAIVWEDERDNITPFPSGKYGDHRRG